MKKLLVFTILYLSVALSARTIATSIAPICDIIAQLTKNIDQTFYIVKKNQNPHTFALTPKDMKLLSKADIFIQVGFGFDKWANALPVKKLTLSKVIVPIDASKNKKIANPHYWLSPANDIIITKTIFSFLTNQFPEQKINYTKNYTIFIKQLQKIDANYKNNLKSTTPFISSHPILNYVARDYNLNLIDIVYKQPGTEPKPRDLSTLLTKIKTKNIKIIFLKSGFPRNKLTRMIHSPLNVYAIDPIGINTDSLLTLLTENFHSLKLGLTH